MNKKLDKEIRKLIDCFQIECNKEAECIVEEIENALYNKASYNINEQGTISVQLYNKDPFVVHLTELLPKNPQRAKKLWEKIKTYMAETFEDDQNY